MFILEGLLMGFAIAAAIVAVYTVVVVVPFVLWLERSSRRHRRARLEIIHEELRDYPPGTLHLH